MESFGWLFCFLSGEVRTGIQQESEWPYSSHSRVHFPVRATSGRGLESESKIELSLQMNNIVMTYSETENLKFTKGIFKGLGKNVEVSSAVQLFYIACAHRQQACLYSYPQPQELKNKTIKPLPLLVNQSQKHLALGANLNEFRCLKESTKYLIPYCQFS